MDVNLTISLMRGQMGIVIENAVNVAVETVLGEMIRVVGLKFDDFKREIAAKEQENKNIRQLLEVTRCQVKALRKYVNIFASKDDRRPAPTSGHLPGQLNVRTQRTRLDEWPVSQRPRQRRGPECAELSSVQSIQIPRHTRNPDLPKDSDRPTFGGQRRQLPNVDNLAGQIRPEDQTNINICPVEINTLSEHMAPVREENSLEEDNGGLLIESCLPTWDEPHQVTSDPRTTEILDTCLLPLPNQELGGDTDTDPTTAACVSTQLKVKEEESEVEIVCIKDELLERTIPSTSDCPRTELPQQDTATVSTASAGSLGMAGSLEISLSSALRAEMPQMAVPPSIYGDSQQLVEAGPRPARAWQKDLNLYEEYKRHRAELRRRSQNRKREVEQNLPQALLSDLVRERREKTRLRVARWRAKRKMQACLMNSQAAQLSSPQALVTLPAGLAPRQGRPSVAPVYAGFSQSQSGTGAYNQPLQLGSNPLAQVHTHSLMQSGTGPPSQQTGPGTGPGPGPESYQ